MQTNKKYKKQIPDYEELFREGAGEKNSKKSNGIPRMLLKQNIGKIVISMFLYIVKNSPAWAIPLITAEVINLISDPEDMVYKKLFLYGAILFVLLIQNIPTHALLYERYVNNTLRTIGAGLRNTLIKKLQHLSLTYRKEIETGKIQSKFLRDIEAIEFFNSYFIKSVLPCILNVLVSIAVVLMKSKAVTLFFVIVIPVNVGIICFFRSSMSNSNKKFRKETENISAKVFDMLSMLPVTKAHGLENEEIATCEENIRKLREKGLILDNVNAYFGSVTWVLSQLMSAVCLFFTSFLAIKGKISVGEVVLYQSYFSSISNNVQSLTNIYPELTKGLESIRSVSEIILSDKIEDNRNKIRLRYVHGSVEFCNASYKYPDASENTISDFSLSVKPGECIAFVGASGSGKSTVMNMIIGFLFPTSGEIKIDGKPIDSINLSDYRHFISVVPQNSILFRGSIKENITYGLENVSEDKLKEIVELANINEFANGLPQGLDTLIGEDGAKLSGGQKQRISIARALIRDPKILILDEATSALDNISEYQVQKAISRLIKGRTTFIVAHRLSTIRDADRIIVMENGKCVEHGTFSELMAKKGRFFELKTLNDMNTSEL